MEPPSSSCVLVRVLMDRTIAQRPRYTVTPGPARPLTWQWTLEVVVCAALAGVPNAGASLLARALGAMILAARGPGFVEVDDAATSGSQ
jgi:hypothetical protein